MIPPRSSRQEPGAGRPSAPDPHAFAAQYRDAYPRLTLVAAAVTGERESAEDIVQEAAMIALEKFEQFSPGSNFSAWMAEIVRRCALNYRRKTKQRRTYAADPAALGQINSGSATAGEPWPIAHDSGQVVPEQASFDDQLAGALAQLGDEARACLLLRIVDKLSYAEISDLLGIPEGTAMSHVHRSKAALRKHLTRAAAVDAPANERPAS
jgi:RNA polymerase sigma-70 factor (ECF subfamily)